MLNRLKKILSIPETDGLNLDDPSLTEKRREVIKNKGFLCRIYTEWYELIATSVPSGQGDVLEIGAGGGFLKELIPSLITSEVFPCMGVDRVMDACGQWPFDENQLKAVLMVDVFHHLPEARIFFSQAETAVQGSGVIAMIEPWVTPWSRLIYSHLHHEPFEPLTQNWTFPASGPLSGANSALPWIIFSRDRHIFENEFPNWNIETIQPIMPFSYLLSGGVSLRSFLSGSMYHLVRQAEKWSGLDYRLAMFAFIVLRRI